MFRCFHYRPVRSGLALCLFGLAVSVVASAKNFVLVEEGAARAPIIVPADIAGPTAEAVEELVVYIKKISGADIEVLKGAPDATPESAVWVGMEHEGLASLFPGADLELRNQEEIIHLGNGRHLLIAGRDRVVAGEQIEYGTLNSIYTFIEKRLNVRWLWPGELGEDIPESSSISLPEFEYRHSPKFRMRRIRPRQPREWHVRQRLFYDSQAFWGGHAYGKWWDLYHEKHPDYFALLPNGTRKPLSDRGNVAKLCLSNPGVAELWLKDAEEYFRANPHKFIRSASPNDGGGHCVCENCKAWDHPDAPDSLTERHVKYFNVLARGLQDRFPDRTIYVGAYAYAAYKDPPVAEKLEPNVAIGHVAHFPLTGRANREQTKLDWLKWGELSTALWYRPNLWYWAGGVWGLPELALNRSAEDFRFLADNKCLGLDVDTVRNVWSTQGPQYYILAQLAYDPYQDGDALLADYYSRAFGPAAKAMEKYWNMLDEATDALMDDPEFDYGSANRYKLVPIFERVYSPERMAGIERALREAEALAADSELYSARVGFVRAGFDFTQLVMRSIPLMTRLRESKGKDVAAARQALGNWNRIREIGEAAPPHALPMENILDWIGGKRYMGRMQDYFGPPSEALLGPMSELQSKATEYDGEGFE